MTRITLAPKSPMHSTFRLPRSTVYRVIKDREKHQERIDTGSKRPGRMPKLSRRGERALIRYVNQNPKDTLRSLSSPSKSGQQIHINTVRKSISPRTSYTASSLIGSHSLVRDTCNDARSIEMGQGTPKLDPYRLALRDPFGREHV